MGQILSFYVPSLSYIYSSSNSDSTNTHTHTHTHTQKNVEEKNVEETVLNLDFSMNTEPEINVEQLLQLPGRELRRLCRQSKQVASFCRDPLFWREKAHLDFDFPVELFDEFSFRDPREGYREVRSYIRRPCDSLFRFVAKGRLKEIEYILKHSLYLSRDVMYRACLEAASRGHFSIVQYLVDQSGRLDDEIIRRVSLFGSLPTIKSLMTQYAHKLSQEEIKEIILSGLNSAVCENYIAIVRYFMDFLNQLDQSSLHLQKKEILETTIQTAFQKHRYGIISYLTSSTFNREILLREKENIDVEILNFRKTPR